MILVPPERERSSPETATPGPPESARFRLRLPMGRRPYEKSPMPGYERSMRPSFRTRASPWEAAERKALRSAARRHEPKQPTRTEPRRRQSETSWTHSFQPIDRASAGPSGSEDFFFAPVEPAVDELDALHERVVLVADLVLPGPEAAAREDALRLEVRVDRVQGSVAVGRRDRVRVRRVDQEDRLDALRSLSSRMPSSMSPLTTASPKSPFGQRLERRVRRLGEQAK